jgi:hypothetical protein
MNRLCHECRADEFSRRGDDWVCANGHVQNWTIVSQERQFRGMEKRPHG